MVVVLLVDVLVRAIAVSPCLGRGVRAATGSWEGLRDGCLRTGFTLDDFSVASAVLTRMAAAR
jgi:hypothetical protein